MERLKQIEEQTMRAQKGTRFSFYPSICSLIFASPLLVSVKLENLSRAASQDQSCLFIMKDWSHLSFIPLVVFAVFLFILKDLFFPSTMSNAIFGDNYASVLVQQRSNIITNTLCICECTLSSDLCAWINSIWLHILRFEFEMCRRMK